MNKINLENIPSEPTIIILNPDGSELITTNNPTTLQYIRFEIKRNKLSGYKIRTVSDYVADIKTNGKLSAWPDGEIPGDVLDKLTRDLI